MAALAIVCPGQGAQHPAMFDLALQSAAAAEWLDAYSATADIDVVALARSGNDRGDGLFSNRNGQLLVCAAAVANWVALSPMVPQPLLFAGYSAGEMAAYGCAGAWTAAGLAHIVSQRAECMDAVAPPDGGLMAVKGLRRGETIALCREYRLAEAIVVADDHMILGGRRGDLGQAAQALERQGVWHQLLDVAVPSHTPLMRDAVAPFRAAVLASPLRVPDVAVLAGVDGCPTATAAAIADTLAAQLAQPVDWLACMQNVVERGANVVLEVGAGKNLAKMFAEYDEAEKAGGIESRSCDDFRSLEGIAAWINARCA